MKPVTVPLRLQMKRVEVGDLHQALAILGRAIAAAEKDTQRFGASTRAAVMQFQTAHKLPATGEVDKATAKVINKELADNGVLDPAPGGSDLPPSNPPTQDPQSSNIYLVAGRRRRKRGGILFGAIRGRKYPSHYYKLWEHQQRRMPSRKQVAPYERRDVYCAVIHAMGCQSKVRRRPWHDIN